MYYNIPVDESVKKKNKKEKMHYKTVIGLDPDPFLQPVIQFQNGNKILKLLY